MKFPCKKYDIPHQYLNGYFQATQEAWASLSRDAFDEACEAIEEVYVKQGTVFVCGNGGSAAIANHTVCDHGKLIATDTSLSPKVISLSNSIEMITAIANDISYDEVFSYQLEKLGAKEDVLIIISGSGSSPNVCRALSVAQFIGMKVIAMTAFDGGDCRKEADISLHIDCENYGIAEDVHQALMQNIAQFIRVKHLAGQDITSVKF